MNCYSLEEYNKSLEHVLGGVTVTPNSDTQFSGCLNGAGLGPISILSILSTPLKSIVEPTSNCYNFTIPLLSSAQIKSDGTLADVPIGQIHLYSNTSTAHMNTHPSTLNGGLVFRICTEDFNDNHYIPFYVDQLKDNLIDTSSKEGHQLFRAITRGWSKFKLLKAHNRLAETGELELELSMAVVEWLESFASDKPKDADLRSLKIAEEFLNSKIKDNVERRELEDATGVSIRTLSRLFKKHHGIGPMHYLKQRRLNGAYIELFRNCRTTSSVASIAKDFRLDQLGRFAVQYKSIFGESPSRTLVEDEQSLTVFKDFI